MYIIKCHNNVVCEIRDINVHVAPVEFCTVVKCRVKLGVKICEMVE